MVSLNELKGCKFLFGVCSNEKKYKNISNTHPQLFGKYTLEILNLLILLSTRQVGKM